ncbi:MAG: hypothetical protein WAW37_02690 [Syntrophobacteraceae bacterium]
MNKYDISGEAGKAFARRIRTRVVGPRHGFGVVVPRELAPVCLRELSALGITGAEPGEAGAEFNGRLKDAYLCNLRLRTASRVFCRLPSFRAGIAEELFYKVSEVDWELWLSPDVPLEIDAHVEYSRISHEGKVVELVRDGIEKAIRQGPAAASELRAFRGEPAGKASEQSGEPAPKQRILVHLVKNHCRISIDMSGNHLHERGYRTEHTGAPLRETLAAAILMKSEWNGDTPLVDGMCGSGTFPIEAALIARRLPPGLGREFLFQKWPSFQKQTWDYLCQSARAASRAKAPAPIFGVDMDSESIRISGDNAKRAGVEGDIELRCADFFEFDPRREKVKNGLLVLNPPYGKRLEGGGRSLYEKIGDQLRRAFGGWRYAVLCASRGEAGAMKMPLMRLWGIRHGGIPIYAALGKIPP